MLRDGRPTWSSRSASSRWCSAGSPDDAPAPRWSGACTTGSTGATSPGSWCPCSATSPLGWSTGSWSTAAPRWPRSGPARRRSWSPPRPSPWTRATSTRPATRYDASSCSRGCRRGRDRTCSCAPSRAFDGSPAEAFIVGGALFGENEYEQSLKKLAVDLGIADRVHFVGHVHDPWAWLVDADVLVHASTIPEPFGQVVVQGLWARCAVVASTPGGPAEVITDGVDGLLTPCGDVEALAAALARLRADHDLRRSLARHGRVTAGTTTPPSPLRCWTPGWRTCTWGRSSRAACAASSRSGADLTVAAGLTVTAQRTGPTRRAARAGTLLVRAAASASVRPARATFRVSVSRPMASRGASTAATTAFSGSSVSNT